MPLQERPEYNPFILGFVEDRGPIFIPLQEAREKYGHLPSEFEFVQARDGRFDDPWSKVSLRSLPILNPDRETILRQISSFPSRSSSNAAANILSAQTNEGFRLSPEV